MGKYIIVWFLLFFTATSFSATFYVDISTGNDSNDGLSRTTALQTLQRASLLMHPGDRCLVQPGFYDERLSINTSGSEGMPITYQADGEVETKGFVINRMNYIKIIGFRMVENGIHIKEGSYCEIRDNTIHNTGYVGIDLTTNPSYADNATSSHCIVSGNTITYAVKCGIRIMGRNHLIDDNEINHTLRCSPYSSYCDDSDGMRFFGSGHVISNNYIHDILHEPENFEDPHIDFFQTWGPASNITIEGNLCFSPNTSNSNQIIMTEEINAEVEKLLIRNNIFIMSDPGYCALNIHQKNAGQTIDDVTIVNNLFYHRNIAGPGQFAIYLTRVQNLTIQNNIFYNFGEQYKNYVSLNETTEDVVIGNNNFYLDSGTPPRDGPFPGDLWMINPLFVDAAGSNFQLMENSPLIDAGISLPTIVPLDFQGKRRPLGSGFDIGPNEYGSESVLEAPQNLRLIEQ